MGMPLALGLFALGVLLVVKGGDVFVDAAAWIARASGIPAFIVGATIVSVATTLPEMLVSMLAAAMGKTEMAVGNAVGSVTANTGLILAVGMLFLCMACPRAQYARQCLLLAGAAGVLWLGCRGGSLHPAAAVGLLLIFALFVGENVRQARGDRAGGGASRPERLTITRRDAGINFVKFVLGAGCIVAGSQLLVNAGGEIALLFGVPERTIAVTLVAVGTSLPELVTMLSAVVKRESGISAGNIIGANVIDLSLILPLCGVAGGRALPVSAQSLALDIPVCAGMVLLAILPMLVRQRTSRVQGAVLLGTYAAYLAAVL